MSGPTNPPLAIPDEAVETLAVCDYDRYHHEQDVECVRAIAAPVVAAELRRLADVFEATAQEWREEDVRTIRSSGLGHAVRELRKRADELDGGDR